MRATMIINSHSVSLHSYLYDSLAKVMMSKIESFIYLFNFNRILLDICGLKIWYFDRPNLSKNRFHPGWFGVFCVKLVDFFILNLDCWSCFSLYPSCFCSFQSGLHWSTNRVALPWKSVCVKWTDRKLCEHSLPVEMAKLPGVSHLRCLILYIYFYKAMMDKKVTGRKFSNSGSVVMKTYRSHLKLSCIGTLTVFRWSSSSQFCNLGSRIL